MTGAHSDGWKAEGAQGSQHHTSKPGPTQNISKKIYFWGAWPVFFHLGGIKQLPQMGLAPRPIRAGGLTLPVRRVLRVGVVEGLLALPDGGRQRQVSLHHPLLVAVQHRLARHGQGMAFGDVLGQRGEGLLGLGKDTKGVGG